MTANFKIQMSSSPFGKAQGVSDRSVWRYIARRFVKRACAARCSLSCIIYSGLGLPVHFVIRICVVGPGFSDPFITVKRGDKVPLLLTMLAT